MPAMLIPGIMDTSTANEMTSDPTRRSLLYCAALGLQNKRGANNSHKPTAAAAHCAHQAVLLESESAPKHAVKSPLITSLATSKVVRHSSEASPIFA